MKPIFRKMSATLMMLAAVCVGLPFMTACNDDDNQPKTDYLEAVEHMKGLVLDSVGQLVFIPSETLPGCYAMTVADEQNAIDLMTTMTGRQWDGKACTISYGEYGRVVLSAYQNSGVLHTVNVDVKGIPSFTLELVSSDYLNDDNGFYYHPAFGKQVFRCLQCGYSEFLSGDVEFDECPKCGAVDYNGTFPYYHKGQKLYYCIVDREKQTVRVESSPSDISGDVEIPEKVYFNKGKEYTVTQIGANAFKGCKNLRTVSLPQCISSIEESAFYGCEQLRSIAIPEGVEYVGIKAFAGCYALASVTIPESLTFIPMEAFHGCRSLTSITFPKNLQRLGATAFYRCHDLTIVRCLGEPASLHPDTFADDACQKGTLIVPDDLLQAYLNAAYWNSFSKIVKESEYNETER